MSAEDSAARAQDEEAKIDAFMQKEEADIEAEFSRLMAARHRWVNIRLRLTSDSKDDIIIKTQPQKRKVLIDFQNKMGQIDQRLLTAKPEDILDPPLTLEQQNKLAANSLELIEKATGLPRERFEKEIDDLPVMNLLVDGIFQISTQTTEQLEAQRKFRGNR